MVSSIAAKTAAHSADSAMLILRSRNLNAPMKILEQTYDGGCKVRDEYHFVKSDAINLVMNIALFTAKL
jgi:hypothetical protein